jgi:hypothetical protein
MLHTFESTPIRIGAGVVTDAVLIIIFPLSVFAILLSGGYDPEVPGCADRHHYLTLALFSLVVAIGIFTWFALQPWHIEGRIVLHLIAAVIAMLVFAALGFGSAAFGLAIGAAALTSPAVLIPLPEELVGRRVIVVLGLVTAAVVIFNIAFFESGWDLCHSTTIN